MHLAQSLRPPGLQPMRLRSAASKKHAILLLAGVPIIGRRPTPWVPRLSRGTTQRWIVSVAPRGKCNITTLTGSITKYHISSSSTTTTTTTITTPATTASTAPTQSTLPTLRDIRAAAGYGATGSACVLPGTQPAAPMPGISEPRVAKASGFGWRRLRQLPEGCGARQRVVAHWRPGDAAAGGGGSTADGGGGAAADAADGASPVEAVPGGAGGSEVAVEAGEASGVQSQGYVAGGGGSSIGGGAGFGGSSSPVLSAERILEVSEAYVDAWWRGVARGSDAAAEALSELVATGHAGPMAGGGGGSASTSVTGSWAAASGSVTASGVFGSSGGGGGGGGAESPASVADTTRGAAASDAAQLPSSVHEHHPAPRRHYHHRHHYHHHHHHTQQEHQEQQAQQQQQQQHEEHPSQRQEVLALMPDGVLHRRPLRGYDALMGQLAASHTEYHRVQYRPVTSAACPASSCGYVLGEFRMQDVGGLAGHPATFRVSRGYCLFKLRLDSVSGRISRGWVRRQMTQEERDERVWDPVHVYPAPFPLERLHLTRGGSPDPRVMEEAARAWVAAQAKPPPPRRRQLDLRPEGAAAAAAAAADTEHAVDNVSAAVSGVTPVGAGSGFAPGSAADEDVMPAAPEETRGSVGTGGGAAAAAGGLTSLSTAGHVSSITPELTSGGGAAAAGTAAAPAAEPAGPAGGSAPPGEVTGDAAAASVPPSEVTAATLTPEQSRLMDQVLAPDCRLLDAYGVFPDPDEDEAGYGGGGLYGAGRRTHPVVGADNVLKRIHAQQRRCSQIEPMLYDVAVSEDHNIAFVHWVNIVTPAAEPPAPKPAAITTAKQPSKTAAVVTHGSVAVGSGRSAGLAVAASSAASAAATAASAAAQAATAAADVATTAASAASVAANSASTAATIAATAATAAAFAAGADEAEAQLKSARQQQQQQQQQHLLQPHQSPGTDAAVMRSEQNEASKGESAVPATEGKATGSRPIGLQDLRLSMPSIPKIPELPIQIQIQNLEEALSAAAQRVGHAAGTAAAAASAAAAAATAVIMAETAAGGGGPGASKGAAPPQRKAAAATPPPPALPVPYQQECMAALLFHDDGTVSDVWLFRGPFHHERKLLRP